jgi:DNA-binding SARP family transcriptional activator
MNRHTDPARSRADLEQGLSLAVATRYTMFFRLVPAMAASVCALALRAEVSPLFVDEVIRARKLPAPTDADARWPWPLWLGLLGGFELRCDGQLEPGTAKTQQKPLELLRLLACERNLSLGMEAAMAALWPDADEAAARKSFEMAALRLRRLLGDATLLRVGDGRVGLDAARASSDVQQRRRLIERIEALAMRSTGQSADPTSNPGPGPHDECLVLVERVIGFTRGDLLPGLPAVPWLEAERQRCRNDTVRAALAAATVLERSLVGTAERELLETALRIEPLAESLVRRLMHAHTRAGQRGDALRVFESYRQQLAAAGAAPGPQIDAQWRALLAPPLR